MSSEAWPFLIGRTGTEDHRIVVLPDFITDPPLIAALRSTGGEPGRRDTACFRELVAVPGEPVTAVYRVRTARHEEYGLSGDELLTDEHGRPIVLTEGIVLREASRVVQETGITLADLDRAHDLVAPAYRRFWAEGSEFSRLPTGPFTLAPRKPGEALLTLEKNAPPPPLKVPQARRAEPHGLVGEPAPHAPVPVPRRQQPTGKRRVTWLIVVILVAGLAVGGWLLYPPAGPASLAAQTMARLCQALHSGRPATGYALTTSSYQSKTSKDAFTQDLLPVSGTAGTQCMYTAPVDPAGSTVQATLTVIQGQLPATFWFVTLARENASSWQVAAITAVPPS